MAKATAFNPTTKERKEITVGDANAFAGGFILETPTNNLQTYKAPTPVGTAVVKPIATPTPQVLGLQAAEARQKAGTANATDIANLDYAKSKGIDYSGINSIADANKAINEGQQNDADSATKIDEVPVRKTVTDIMADVAKTVTPAGTKNADGTTTSAAPGAPNYTKTLTDYRESYGVTDLEKQVDDLRAQEQELLATKDTRVANERDKTVAMNVIEGRVSTAERQENERINQVQRQITNATNQLNTKYNIINTLMKTKEMDYNGAVASYDKEMSTNIALFNTAKGIEEADKTEQNRNQDNARSNAQIVINSYTASGATYDSLSATDKTSLIKLGVESGLGADFFSNVLKTSAGKAILTTIPSADDTKVSIIYKDGTTKTVATGLPAKKVSGSGVTVSPEETARTKEVTAFKTKASDLIEKLDAGDIAWSTAYQSMKTSFPGLEGAIDEALGGGYDANSGQWYGRAVSAAKIQRK